MPGKARRIPRDGIVKALEAAVKPLPYVRSFWEGGAVSFDREDRFSDIDAYLYVDEGKEAETFEVVEKALLKLSPISLRYVPKEGHPGVTQAFYRLERADEYHLLDLAVMTPRSPELFLEPEIHGRAVFHFNKKGGVKVPHLDEKAFSRQLRETFERCRARFLMFNNFVEKEIARGNLLEAMDYYYGITLSILVVLLRMKHDPHHHNFRMRYVHYELPPATLRRLERLYLVKDVGDLKAKYRDASRWVWELLEAGPP